MAPTGPAGPLDFSDWLSRRDNTKSSGWIVVGQIWQTDSEHLSTFSYLVANDSLKSRLTAQRGGVNSHDAVSETIAAYLESRAYGSVTDPDINPAFDSDRPIGPDKRPFAIETSYYGFRPFDIDLIQAFVLYWNAWWDGDVLKRIDFDGTLHDVASKTREGDNVRLEVDAHHLRSFLSVAGAGLLRIHDNTRYSGEKLAADAHDSYSDTSGIFDHYSSNGLGSNSYKSFGRVMGKDVVAPYPPSKEDPREPTQGFERFVIGRNPDGSEREASADESLGEAPFLTPVYFRSEVLRKYYDAPSRYGVETGYLRCVGLWGIPFERRVDDLVQVWLGDLGQIPHIDQRHWRAHGVQPPDTGVSDVRFRRDFGAEFIDPQGDVTFDFKQALRLLNESCAVTFGAPMFRPLSEADQHVFDGLRVPVSDGPEESDNQITALAKITADSLNNDLLRSQIPAEDIAPGDQSITLLQKALAAWSVADPNTIVEPLRELFRVRSTGAAHRRGSNWEAALRRAGLLDLENKELVSTLIRRTTNAISLLRREMLLRASGSIVPPPSTSK